MKSSIDIKRILVIRFRQMGDAVLATAMLNTLRRNYPDAVIDFVLNSKIAPLFAGHPSIDNIITFTEEERHHSLMYIRKIFQTVHHQHYDVIIDMRSTFNTMLFCLLSPATKFRIGIRKSYTHLAYNYLVDSCKSNENMIAHNMNLLSPLPNINIEDKNISLYITNEEKEEFRRYMSDKGIDFSQPIILCGVTAKLAEKTWPEDKMADILHRTITEYPNLQIILNYAPGKEEDRARNIYEKIGCPENIFIDIMAKSSRQLAAMASFCTSYFGNEGGARHIVQAMGKPSFVICSPMANKATWLPEGWNIKAEGIAPSDLSTEEQLNTMDYRQQYDLITVDVVWSSLSHFLNAIS